MANWLEWLKAKIKGKSTIFFILLMFLAVVLEMLYLDCINGLCKI